MLWVPDLIDLIDLTGGDDEQAGVNDEGGQQQGPLDVCASIAGLTRLKELECCSLEDVANSTGLSACGVVPGDVLALTALTALTHLRLSGGGACVSDAAAAALACSLKQLRYLDLRDCELGPMACVGAIAQLRHLSCLLLDGNPGITQQGLMMLTRLPNLSCLVVDKMDEVSEDFLDSFRVNTARHLRPSSHQVDADSVCYVCEQL